MTVLELLEGLRSSRDFGIDSGIKRKTGPLNVEIKGIAYDSRLVDKGFLFVAIKGLSVNGHDYIKDALSRGATAVVAEEAVVSKVTEQLAIQNKTAYVEVADSRKALALISAAFYREPSKKLSLIGITGTNGKTTTSYIIKSILDAWGKNVGLLGTIYYIIGNRTIESHYTTPESLDLQRYLREMLNNRVEYSVLEVSSHALALNRVEGCSFKVAAFTNFSQDHLDFHRTMAEYFRAKAGLFTYLSSEDYAVLNYDDPMVKSLTQKLNCSVITCGLEKGAMLRAGDIKEYRTLYQTVQGRAVNRLVHGRAQSTEHGVTVPYGLSFEIQAPEGNFTVESGLVGRFNVYNILVSIGIAYALGVSKDIIQKGVREAKPVEGRFERIDEGQEFLCIVDYAHTEDALKKLIDGARFLTKGRVITVFGCGGDRDKSKRPLMGAAASELSDMVFITSDNPRTEDPIEIIKGIIQGIKSKNYTVQPDRAEAIREAVSVAREGDTLLIAGKGHEDYQEIKGVRYPFSDKEALRKAIQESRY